MASKKAGGPGDPYRHGTPDSPRFPTVGPRLGFGAVNATAYESHGAIIILRDKYRGDDMFYEAHRGYRF